MDKVNSLISFILVVLLFASCSKAKDVYPIGKKPIYLPFDSLLQFQQTAPEPIRNAGKINYRNQILFLGEQQKGIHIIDMSDSTNPHLLSFLKIPGNIDMTISGDFLYADNGPHLVVLNIADLNNVQFVSRQLNQFKQSNVFPKNYSGRFECIDEQKGWVIDWKTDTNLVNPKCYL